MKRVIPVLCIVFSMLLVVPVGLVNANSSCEPGKCFESNGYRVEIVTTDDHGNFPQYACNGSPEVCDSIFKYRVTKIDPRAKLILGIDTLIPPGCIAEADVDYRFEPCKSCCSENWYAPGKGDPLTGFGLALTSATFRGSWPWTLTMTSGDVSLIVKGKKIYASPNSLLLQAGLLKEKYPFGQILSPSCTLVPPPAFPTQVPLVIGSKNVETINGMKVCTESTDQSGCPTNVYWCDDPAKTPWSKVSFSDILVEKYSMSSILSIPDPRCPAVYFAIQSEVMAASIVEPGYEDKCIRCNVNTGFCFVGNGDCSESRDSEAFAAQRSAMATIVTPPECVYPIHPFTSFKQEKINDVWICTVSTESDGCNTQLWECDEGGNLIPDSCFTQNVPAIGLGTLKWVGDASDLKCYDESVYIVTEGSTCVQKCTRSRTCTCGPPGCIGGTCKP